MTTMTSQPMKFEAPDKGEEAARAELYGLLARLFYGPPPQEFLDAIAHSQSDGEGVLHHAWNALAAACSHAESEKVRDEYETLFIGVGKPEIMLYGSYYLSGFLMEKPLAALREDLARLGLARDESMPESEDHVAALCEVMRYLIESGDAVTGGLSNQREFFMTHLQPWVIQMGDVVIAHPRAELYAEVARLAKQFFEVELQAFDMS